MRATLVLVRQFRLLEVPDEGGHSWLEWADLATAWINEEIAAAERDDYHLPPAPTDESYADLVRRVEGVKAPDDTLSRDAQAHLWAEIVEWHRREWAPNHPRYPEPPFRLRDMLDQGWPYQEEPESAIRRFAAFWTRRRGHAAAMVRRSQEGLPSPNAETPVRWFPIFCGFFSAELKRGGSVLNIFNATLVSELRNRLLLLEPVNAGLEEAEFQESIQQTLSAAASGFTEHFDGLVAILRDGNATILDRLLVIENARMRDAVLLELLPVIKKNISRLEEKVDSSHSAIVQEIRLVGKRIGEVGLDAPRKFQEEWREVLSNMKREVVKALHGEADEQLAGVCDRFVAFASANEKLLEGDECAWKVAEAFATGLGAPTFAQLEIREMARQLGRLLECIDAAIATTWSSPDKLCCPYDWYNEVGYRDPDQLKSGVTILYEEHALFPELDKEHYRRLARIRIPDKPFKISPRGFIKISMTSREWLDPRNRRRRIYEATIHDVLSPTEVAFRPAHVFDISGIVDVLDCP